MGYEKRQFLYGMDFDTEERLVEQGFTRKNVNVRIGSSTSDGILSAENVQGNKLIPNVELPSGDNKVIGSYWYELKNLNYYFVWNSDGNHGIYEYDHVPSKITRVMIAEVLNFQEDALVTGVNVVEFDDTNDLLYWVDGYNPPRKINIQKAKEDGYVTPIEEAVIDAIKYPPLCPPTASYMNDNSVSSNYFEDVIWQFKAAYVYDDKEVSAFSPISVQVLPSFSCLSESQGNTIKITIPKGGELVERVIIAGREGNLNDFLEIEDQEVDKYELDADGNYVYYFKNDGVYNALDLNQSIKLFDNVPQVAKAQEFIKNRITYANITEGYDNVDVDLDVSIDVAQESEEVSSNTIKGFLRISNNSLKNEYENFQPIHDPGTGIVFGGFSSGNLKEDVGSKYKQHLPLGGFVIYLAGTDFYAITKQIRGTVPQLQKGSTLYYDSSTGGYKRRKIRKEIEGASSGVYTESRTWSTWSIDNVPDGTYVLRVASNYTNKADLLDPSRPYQKTSTYVQRIGFNDTSGSTQNPVKELEVTVQNGQIIDNVEVVISDLSAPSVGQDSAAVSGYLVNPDTSSYTPPSIDDALGQKRIDKARIRFKNGVFLTNTPDLNYIDHNGFFYTTGKDKYSIEYVKAGLYQDPSITAYDLFSGGSPSALPSTYPVGQNSLGVFIVNSSSIYKYSKATALFNFIDSEGNGVKGINVITSAGDSDISDSNGIANVSVYTNVSVYSGSGSVPITRKFYFYADKATCDIDFSSSVITYDFNIGDQADNDGGDPIIPVEMPTITITVSDTLNKASLKKGGVYEFGIVYYDKANRSGATNKGKELVVPFYTEQVNGNLLGSSKIEFNWEIKNNPPSWATHYQIVRTKNSVINQYIQWYTDEISYTDLYGNPSNSSDGQIIELDITNLTDEYKTANPDSVLVYDYTSRDRIRFIKDSSNNYFDEYIDVKVLGFDTGIIKVENLSSLPDLSDGVMFEIYTPKLESEEDIFYEIGECYEIGEATAPNGGIVKYHKGGIFDQNPFTGSPATGVLKGGDTYYRTRSIIAQNGIFISDIDSQLFSDFWQSKVSDIGRPNIVDKDAKRVTRPTTIYYSERFIPETNINGLNSFYDTSFETYARENGSIQKLFSNGNTLDCIQELRTGSILVEENVTYTPDGNPILSYSDNVLNKIKYYAMRSGTLNPESFAYNEGRRYFFDIRNGKVIRLSTDGMTAISDNKMHSYFESKSNFYSAFNIIPEIWGTYDRAFDEYVIGFGEVSRPEGFTPDELALVSSQAETVTTERDGLTYTFIIGYEANEQGTETDFTVVRDVANGTYVINSSAGDLSLDRQKILSIPAETVGFSENTKHWTSFYTYTPECMSRVGIDFLSFRNGQCFLHNQTGDRNTFYGERASSEVWVVFNQDPGNNKVFQALSEESDSVWEAREIVTQKGQKSNLILDDFAVDYGQGHTLYSKENIHYASLWQDENTPNVDLPLINGDSMRDASIIFKLINDSVEQERLFAASVRYSLSPRTNR